MLGGLQYNYKMVNCLGDPDTIYYGSWNSDQWINWLRRKYEKEAKDRQRSEALSFENMQELRGSWVNIVIPATEEDFQTSYASDSAHAYTDPQKSDYFWSDYAYPV